MQLRDKRAIVCGATQGIGLAAAQALAADGATVLLVARNADRLAAALGALGAPAAQRHATLTTDLSDAEGAAAAVAGWLAANGAVDILVNNSGGPPGGPIVEATPDAFRAAFEGHLLTSHRLAQTVLPGMRERGGGRIINVVSTSVRQPIPGLGVSNTTRAAVAGWAKTLAGEVGRWGVTVNNVLPGATRTGRLDAVIDARAARTGVPRAELEQEMEREIPLGRFGEAAEIAAAIAFLAGPGGSYITGVSLPVDGGRIQAL